MDEREKRKGVLGLLREENRKKKELSHLRYKQ